VVVESATTTTTNKREKRKGSEARERDKILESWQKKVCEEGGSSRYPSWFLS
jgi:hypothetical protein